MVRRAWVVVAALALSPSAGASVSFTVVLDALVEESRAVVVCTPTAASSVWEDGHIVTYTKVHVDRTVAGATSGDVWVRTLGGAVGDIGQQVEGEAALRVGRSTLLFLSTFQGNTVVTARGQGQFSVVTDGAGVTHVQKNQHAGALLGPRRESVQRIQTMTAEPNAVRPAADVLDGRTVDDAATQILTSWKRTHA